MIISSLKITLTIFVCSIISLVTIFSARKKIKLMAKDNAIIITGCDSGFGKLSALLLSEKGFQVIVTCMTEAGAKDLEGKVALVVMCDVTKQKDIDALMVKVSELLKSRSCRLWAVVNNAGIAPMAFLDWASIESYRRVMDVNYFGVISMIKATLPLLKRTENSRIINLSSMAGFSAVPGMGAYSGESFFCKCGQIFPSRFMLMNDVISVPFYNIIDNCLLDIIVGSKHAVEGLVKAIRPELKQWGIHVANINPAFMRSVYCIL